MVENVLREDVFLPIYPEEREGLLCTVKDFRKEATMVWVFLVLVEYFVSF